MPEIDSRFQQPGETRTAYRRRLAQAIREAEAARAASEPESGCSQCGASTRDGNCSPLYEDLCADCGEAKHAAGQATSWTVGSIFDARDRRVSLKDGTAATLRLYADGWAFGSREGMDIWSACAFLNNAAARVLES